MSKTGTGVIISLHRGSARKNKTDDRRGHWDHDGGGGGAPRERLHPLAPSARPVSVGPAEGARWGFRRRLGQARHRGTELHDIQRTLAWQSLTGMGRQMGAGSGQGWAGGAAAPAAGEAEQL